MKFLLVIFIFVTLPNGDIEPRLTNVTSQAYATLEECNKAGRNVRELLGNPSKDIKTLSYCVRPEDYAN